MLTSIFSESSLNVILGYGSKAEGEIGSYSDEEIQKIEETVERLYQKITFSIRPADGDQECILAIGPPASGKTTFMKEFIKESNNDYALIDMDDIREEMDLFNDTISKKLLDGADQLDADFYAYQKYSNASVYIGRTLQNRLFDEGYNMVCTLQPMSFIAYLDNFLPINNRETKLKVKVFDAPKNELIVAAENRTQETGRGLDSGLLNFQYDKLPEAIYEALSIPLNCDFYHRDRHDSDAYLMATVRDTGDIWVKDRSYAVMRLGSNDYDSRAIFDRFKQACADKEALKEFCDSPDLRL